MDMPTLISFILVLGSVVALYFSPEPTTLILIVAILSFLSYGYSKVWRNIHN